MEHCFLDSNPQFFKFIQSTCELKSVYLTLMITELKPLWL